LFNAFIHLFLNKIKQFVYILYMNCLNASGSGINCKKATDILHLNGYTPGSGSWTATASGEMTLTVVGGG